MSYSELEIRKVAKNRKDYRCVWCAQKIERGQSSVSRTYVFDGNLGRERWHPECWEASCKCEDDLSDGWCPGDYPRGGSVAFAEL